jgi:WD40 repeat protein
MTLSLLVLAAGTPGTAPAGPPGFTTGMLRQEETTFQLSPPVVGVAFANDGKLLATAGGEMDKFGEVNLYDLATGKKRFCWKGHADLVLAVAFAPDGKTLASAGWDKTIKLWNTATGKELATLRGHSRQIWSVAFSPDGKLLASSGVSGDVKLWDVATGQQRAALRGCDDAVVVFSPDGRTLAVGDYGGGVTLWDVATGKERAAFKGHSNRVSAAVFAPDGKTLATASWDTTVKLWDVASGRQKAVLLGHKGSLVSLAYSTDGRMLAAACAYHQVFRDGGPGGGITKVVDGGEVKVWEVATGQERLTFEPEKNRSGQSCFLQFTGNGKYLMTVGCPGGAFKKWDLARLAVNPK